MRILVLWLFLALPAWAQTSLYVNFTQPQVEGGASLEGIVASNAPAPPEGLMVRLTAGAGLIVPDRVFIEPGRKAARFPIDTQPVSRNQSIQVRAQVGQVVGLNLVHLMPVGEQMARTPPPSGLVTSGPAFTPTYGDYGYGSWGYGYGYGYGYDFYPPCPPPPAPRHDPGYMPQNLPKNWPGGSGIPADYPRPR